MTRLPATPFDIGQTVYLSAHLAPDPYRFQTPAGQVALYDGTTLVAAKPVSNGPITLIAPYTPGTHA